MADQAELRVVGLPEDALGAAQQFYNHWVAEAEALLTDDDSLAVLLPAVPHDHDDWRRAAARDIARRHAPKRVNIVARGDEDATAALLAYLAKAPGVTGQYFKAS